MQGTGPLSEVQTPGIDYSQLLTSTGTRIWRPGLEHAQLQHHHGDVLSEGGRLDRIPPIRKAWKPDAGLLHSCSCSGVTPGAEPIRALLGP